eukprot:3364837-Ditylum_brightwellii.AAC.1
MKILEADINSIYLMANTKELMHTRLGPEFGDWAGKLVIIRYVLYGLIVSCTQFHCHLYIEHEKIGFTPSKADPDLLMRNAGDQYEYVAKYIDDVLIMSKNPKAILDLLQKSKRSYEAKGIGSPEYYLDTDVKIN